MLTFEPCFTEKAGSDHYQILGEGGQQPSVDENYRTGSQGKSYWMGN